MAAGLDKMDEAADSVSEMRVVLAEKQEVLDIASDEADLILQEVGVFYCFMFQIKNYRDINLFNVWQSSDSTIMNE
jgi:hypothetical protein